MDVTKGGEIIARPPSQVFQLSSNQWMGKVARARLWVIQKDECIFSNNVSL